MIDLHRLKRRERHLIRLGIERMLHDRGPAMGFDRLQSRGSVIEHPGQDQPHSSWAERQGRRAKHRINRRSHHVFLGAPPNLIVSPARRR